MSCLSCLKLGELHFPAVFNCFLLTSDQPVLTIDSNRSSIFKCTRLHNVHCQAWIYILRTIFILSRHPSPILSKFVQRLVILFFWSISMISDTDFPGHFHIQSHPPFRRTYLHKPGFWRKGGFQKHISTPNSPLFLGGLNEYWQKWLLPQFLEIHDTQVSLPAPLLPWSFMSYFMRPPSIRSTYSAEDPQL